MVARMKVKNRKKSDVRKCLICGKKASRTYENFCSLKCTKDYAEYKTINMPIPFVKRLFNHCPNEAHRIEQLKTYAKRHNYREDFVIKRANEINREINRHG